ncbi:uncharacterized protein [Linepithema humile]|uniref:uncharacterized protein isoform X1 n=1 Tax=Linepithema humile TaxID=83485 RepID=UPI00351E0E90
MILNDKTVQTSLLQNIEDNVKNVNKTCIKDIYDSLIYKRIQEKTKFILTYNSNFDGAPLFKSLKQSFWPLQLYINELPVEIRFKNIILAALWLTNKEPKPQFMNLYISTFHHQAAILMERGVDIIVHATGEIINFKVYSALWCVDSVARPIAQNRIQFNGYDGCSWCYIKGKHDGTTMRYPISQMTDPPLRTHEKYILDVQTAVRCKKVVNGVKGYSAMLLFPLLDCVWGFPPDYMHGALLGVTRQIWMKWSKKHLSKSDKEKIDKRLLLLKPPHEIHRLPRSIFDCVKWKASEWRSWMLFYSVLCIQGILRNELFHSYLLFVKSMHTLLTCNISEQDLIECDKNLQIFVLESQKYYGESFMTFNVHSLLHFVESVRISGPLWASSTFPFENGIFLFKQNVNAAKGISYQISVNWLKRYSLHSRIDASSKSIICKEYCYNLFNHRLLTNCVQTENVRYEH